MRRALARFVASPRGNIGIMTALTAPFAIALAAVAVDAGTLYLERRTAQTITDLAAIAAASRISDPDRAALATFADNGFPDIQLLSADHGGTGASGQRMTVVTGRYEPSPLVPAEHRFVAGATPHNAVRVDFSTLGQLHFGSGIMERPTISASAIAGTQAGATFSIGSRLARLEGGVLNRLLGGLLGTSLALSVMDYEALAAADVDLLAFLSALNTQAELRASTFEDVMAAEVRTIEVARALQDALPVGSAARTAAGRIVSASPTGTTRLGRLISLGTLGLNAPGAVTAGLTANVGALALLTNAVSLANGDRQVSVDLDNTIPGLVDLYVALAIGERPQHSPWITVGQNGEVVRTAQTRLRLAIEIGGLGGLLPPVIKVPLYVDIAQSEARLDGIRCEGGRPETMQVDIEARPGIAHLRIGEVSAASLRDFSRPPPSEPARLIQVPILVTVTGFATTEIADQRFSTLTFSRADIDQRRIRTVATTNLTSGLITSLLARTDIRVNVVGLGLGLPSGLTGRVQSALVGAAPAIDTALVSVLAALGLSLGEADVRVHGATCGRAVLVQ
jgi:uncharacterized membrane protein